MNILMLGKNSRCLFNAIRRVLQGKEKATASIVYETIWSWLLKYFDEDKAGVMEAIHKGEYARKLMNPKSGKDISYHDALVLGPSLICQEGLDDAIDYCELDGKARMRIVEDFRAIGLTIRKGCIAKDVTGLLNDHIRHIIRRKKRPFARILSKMTRILDIHPMMAYGLS